VNGTSLYLAIAALHLPGVALLVLLLRDLAGSDPPDSPAGGPPGGGPPRGWRWRRRPRRGGGSPLPARTAARRR
jgi:hypothetical protein